MFVRNKGSNIVRQNTSIMKIHVNEYSSCIKFEYLHEDYVAVLGLSEGNIKRDTIWGAKIQKNGRVQQHVQDFRLSGIKIIDNPKNIQTVI